MKRHVISTILMAMMLSACAVSLTKEDEQLAAIMPADAARSTLAVYFGEDWAKSPHLVAGPTCKEQQIPVRTDGVLLVQFGDPLDFSGDNIIYLQQSAGFFNRCGYGQYLVATRKNLTKEEQKQILMALRALGYKANAI